MIIHCDGCRKKDGTGGWGVVIESQGRIQCFGLGYKNTTNNRMELMGALFLLEYLHSQNEKHFRFYSDSKYLVDGFQCWMHGWQSRSWTKRDQSEIKNLDLWRSLFDWKRLTQSKACWIKGHSENQHNELADLIANYCCKHQEKLHLKVCGSVDDANNLIRTMI